MFLEFPKKKRNEAITHKFPFTISSRKKFLTIKSSSSSAIHHVPFYPIFFSLPIKRNPFNHQKDSTKTYPSEKKVTTVAIYDHKTQQKEQQQQQKKQSKNFVCTKSEKEKCAQTRNKNWRIKYVENNVARIKKQQQHGSRRRSCFIRIS